MTSANAVLCNTMNDGKRRWITEKMRLSLAILPETLQNKISEALDMKKRKKQPNETPVVEVSDAASTAVPTISSGSSVTAPASSAAGGPQTPPPPKKLKLVKR